jgi:hypothetical protein
MQMGFNSAFKGLILKHRVKDEVHETVNIENSVVKLMCKLINISTIYFLSYAFFCIYGIRNGIK